uniref:Uncharacterized protein n=1 Tax=Meloidogyne floridensis TaxID=298350 RepID=A0A915NV00_9BILA
MFKFIENENQNDEFLGEAIIYLFNNYYDTANQYFVRMNVTNMENLTNEKMIKDLQSLINSIKIQSKIDKEALQLIYDVWNLIGSVINNNHRGEQHIAYPFNFRSKRSTRRGNNSMRGLNNNNEGDEDEEEKNRKFAKKTVKELKKQLRDDPSFRAFVAAFIACVLCFIIFGPVIWFRLI